VNRPDPDLRTAILPDRDRARERKQLVPILPRASCSCCVRGRRSRSLSGGVANFALVRAIFSSPWLRLNFPQNAKTIMGSGEARTTAVSWQHPSEGKGNERSDCSPGPIEARRSKASSKASWMEAEKPLHYPLSNAFFGSGKLDSR
jgi:hypothetical protein